MQTPQPPGLTGRAAPSKKLKSTNLPKRELAKRMWLLLNHFSIVRLHQFIGFYDAVQAAKGVALESESTKRCKEVEGRFYRAMVHRNGQS